MKNCPAVTWNFQMNMSQVYDSEVFFPKQSSMQGAACKEANVTSRKAKRRLSLKILKDHDDRRFEYPTSLTREHWQQSAEKWQILRFHTISTSHPCSLQNRLPNPQVHQLVINRSQHVNLHLTGKLHFALRKIFGPPFPPQTPKIP